MKNESIRVVAHPDTKAIVTANLNKPNFGRVMLQQEVTTLNNNFLSTSKRTAFLGGPIDALKSLFTAEGQVVAGNIVKQESFKPFYQDQKPVQYPALTSDGQPNPKAGETVLRHGQPYYIQFIVTEDTTAPLTQWIGATSVETKEEVTAEATATGN